MIGKQDQMYASNGEFQYS